MFKQKDRPPKPGCTCKKCKCVRNYCACYEANIPCTVYCTCFDCRNYEDHPDYGKRPPNAQKKDEKAGCSFTKMVKHVAGSKDGSAATQASSETAANTVRGPSTSTGKKGGGTQPAEEKPGNFLTPEVIDATIQCLLTQAEDGEKCGLSQDGVEKLILHEMNRCLERMINITLPKAKPSSNERKMN